MAVKTSDLSEARGVVSWKRALAWRSGLSRLWYLEEEEQHFSTGRRKCEYGRSGIKSRTLGGCAR